MMPGYGAGRLPSAPVDSFVNKLSDDRLRQMAGAFNFTSDGNIGRAPAQQVQSRSGVLEIADAYVRQTMESEAGTQSEGVRLALYFQRKAGEIDSAFDILADKALFEVVRTALGLPAAMSQADIDVQAAMITKRLDLANLQDPDKLEKFLARFSALYDLSNSGSTTLSAASIILGGQSNVGTDLGLLGSLQRIALGRS